MIIGSVPQLEAISAYLEAISSMSEEQKRMQIEKNEIRNIEMNAYQNEIRIRN